MHKFSGELPQFSEELLQTQGRIENVPRRQRNCFSPHELTFVPENQVRDYNNKTARRGVIIVLQQYVVTVCKLLIDW